MEILGSNMMRLDLRVSSWREDGCGITQMWILIQSPMIIYLCSPGSAFSELPFSKLSE